MARLMALAEDVAEPVHIHGVPTRATSVDAQFLGQVNRTGGSPVNHIEVRGRRRLEVEVEPPEHDVPPVTRQGSIRCCRKNHAKRLHVLEATPDASQPPFKAFLPDGHARQGKDSKHPPQCAAVVFGGVCGVPAAVFVRPINDLRETVTAENAYWQPPSALCRVLGVVRVPAVFHCHATAKDAPSGPGSVLRAPAARSLAAE